MKKVMLTGDRPTGRLHVGHYVGSLRRRVELQNTGDFDDIFICCNILVEFLLLIMYWMRSSIRLHGLWIGSGEVYSVYPVTGTGTDRVIILLYESCDSLKTAEKPNCKE